MTWTDLFVSTGVFTRNRIWMPLTIAVVALLFVCVPERAFAVSVRQDVDEAAKKKEATAKAKKTKKKRTKSRVVLPLPGFIVVQRSGETIPTVTTVPATPSVELAVPAAPTPRSTVRARRTGGVRILPTGRPGGDATVAIAGQIIISEFRVRGPNGANDEFIEIYNNSGSDHVVAAASGTGYGVAASDGTTRCSIPNGTLIPNKGHYLCVNSVGYSLASYPAGVGTTATGDATYTTDIPDNAGIAIFNNNSGGASYSLANRLDAVGSTSEANTLYKEGTGYPALTPFSIDYSFYRDLCGKQGSITTFGLCPTGGSIVDTDNNAANFVFVDTNHVSAGAGQRLGAPGPENLSSPIEQNGSTLTALDPCVTLPSPPNRVRDFTSDPPNNSTFGTIDIRRTFTNNTALEITRLRFRIIDLTTFPAPPGIADLRPRTSTAMVVTVDRAPCGSGTSDVTVNGTTLEQPPSQPLGGGFNSSMSAGIVSLATPLAIGATVDLRFLFGIEQTGSFKVYVNVEAITISDQDQ